MKSKTGFAAVLVSTMLASTMQLIAMGVLAADLIDELDVSRVQIGLLATANSLVGAFLAPRLGLATDRIGPRRSVVVILLVSAASLLFTAIAPTYLFLVLASLTGGVAQGWSNPATNKLISLHIDKTSQGVITGIKQSGVQFSAFLSGLTLPTAAVTIGWRSGIAIYGAFCIAMAGVTRLVVPPDPERTAASDSASTAGLRGPVAPIVWRTTIYATLLGIVGGVVGRFLPLYAHEVLGYSTQRAGLVAALAGLAGIIARISWGRMADTGFSSRLALMLMAGLAATACALLGISTVELAWLAWPVALLVGFGSNAWNTVANLTIIRSVPLADAGRSSGIMLLGFLLGISIGTPAAGFIVDALDTYTPVWIVCTILSAAGMLVARERPTPTT